MRIPPELDQLMWILAEEGSTVAVEEFEARHPECKYELARRISMVRQLKGAGRRAHREVSVPTFRPVARPRSVMSPKLVYAVGALCVAAVAAATYTVVVFTQPGPSVVRNEAPPSIETPVDQPPLGGQRPTQGESPPPTTQQPPVDSPSEPEVDPTPKYLIAQNLKVERAPLTTALQLIATQGGLKLEIGPGMPSPDVSISYEGMNTIEMLQDLGRQYAFTAFDQGNNTVLVIPAVDPSASTEPSGKTPAKTKPDPSTEISVGKEKNP